MKTTEELFRELVDIIAKLRGKDGCPWDKQQTHDTLKSGIIEEAYELVEAINEKNDEKIIEELGDLLMQVLLNAQVAEDEGRFNICDVMQGICDKLKRRHPHVFGGLHVSSAQEVLKNWEDIKSQEREDRRSLMDGIPSSLPSLSKARKVQIRAGRVGFDWGKTEDVLKKVEEEVEELKDSIGSQDHENMEEEIGDILFSIVNLSRFLDVDPESALLRTTSKFINRFRQMESRISAIGKKITDYDLQALDRIWDSIKEAE